ncbi:retropepsin-like aspartic protease family protein [Sphingomonas sp. FW199]|uniref:retropepsin-like aspartic protease family protein n=1 Tax=Sphingomonas sp. FW199 TaxID=3400217 RepID=UPI003CEC84F8
MTEGQVLAMISSIAVLVLAASSLIARRAEASLMLKSVLGWLAIGAVIAVGVAFKSEISWFFNDVGARLGMTNQRVEGGNVRIPKSGDGHFYALVRINGVERSMLVDTGATTTSLSMETAKAAGIELSDRGPFTQVSTANGIVMAREVRIGWFQLGDLETEDLGALVAPNFGDVDVLGMNFLSRLNGWRVEGNDLVLEAGN